MKNYGGTNEEKVCGDGGEIDIEEVTNELCEAQDVVGPSHSEDVFKTNFQLQVHKSSRKWSVPTLEGNWKELETDCSELMVSDTETAKYQQFISYIFSDIAVKVFDVDGCIVKLKEIKSDLVDWYSILHGSYVGQEGKEWWNHIEPHLKKLFRGIIKSLFKLYPKYSHGNLAGGIAVFDGEGRLYNMKHPGKEGYIKDIRSLLQIFDCILSKVPPLTIDNLARGYKVQISRASESYCSEEFKTFKLYLEEFGQGNYKRVNFYTPFFWSHDQRTYFMESMYDIFWREMEFDPRRKVITDLESCFVSWPWEKHIPPGPFLEVFDYNMKCGKGREEIKKVPCMYSIAFWQHCKTYYNDYVGASENQRTIQAIETLLEEEFHIFNHVFQAVCEFIKKYENSEEIYFIDWFKCEICLQCEREDFILD